MIRNIRLWIQKYRRWEFIPSFFFDVPVYLYRIYLSIKAGNLLFFSVSNPCMVMSGFTGYGKYDDLKKFDLKLIPKTILIHYKEKLEDIKLKMKQAGIEYPCIAKPNLGRTGRDIKKLKSDKDLECYLSKVHEEIVIQEFIDSPLEFGIFYYRMPGESKGHITGIVQKHFMIIEGNGKHTMDQLVLDHPRAKYYYHGLRDLHATKRDQILPADQKLQLTYIGNHCRGSLFNDVSQLIDAKLENTADKITDTIEGFYYGRYDIKVNSIQDLYAGDRKILELNGVGSLPTHMFDPRHSLRNAYKTIFHHWDILYRVSIANHKRGYKYISIKKAISIVRKYGI